MLGLSVFFFGLSFPQILEAKIGKLHMLAEIIVN